MEQLLELVKDIWRECQVPTDWCDAVIVPIPKKGDLKQCNNWKGVALLDVVGKVVARILQLSLQRMSFLNHNVASGRKELQGHDFHLSVLWLALKKLGVPQKTDQLIRSFHQGKKAKIHLDGSLLEPTNVQTARDKVAAWHHSSLICSLA